MQLNIISRITLSLDLLKQMKEMLVQTQKAPFAAALIFHAMDRLILNVLDHLNALEGNVRAGGRGENEMIQGGGEAWHILN